MSAEKFESVFNTIKQNNIAYGDSFHAVGNQQVGEEIGARGLAKSIYFNDPNEHLLEIRCYE